MDMQAFIAAQIAARPIEARIVRKVYRALRDAGTPIVAAYDGEEQVPVSTLQDVLNEAFNLDEVYLYTEAGSWVRLTMGEEWDLVCDYTTDLEDALSPVFAYINENGY